MQLVAIINPLSEDFAIQLVDLQSLSGWQRSQTISRYEVLIIT
jgi:hypothetical protein